jgi:hypothetical protein
VTELVIFVEEPSAREMLNGLLPRLLPHGVGFRCIVFERKQDLERQLPKRLRGWRDPNARFVVLRDKDSGDCLTIKQRLLRLCHDAGKPDALVRIACHELESWYLGDLAAVERGLGMRGLARQQGKSKFRAPDRLANPAQELRRLTDNGYQKVAGSRSIGPYLDAGANRSHSFSVFVVGIRRLVAAAG